MDLPFSRWAVAGEHCRVQYLRGDLGLQRFYRRDNGGPCGPEMEKRGYDNRLTYGSLAAGGTLGILIPPSIPMILYGALTGTSVGRLFMAGLCPASSRRSCS